MLQLAVCSEQQHGLHSTLANQQPIKRIPVSTIPTNTIPVNAIALQIGHCKQMDVADWQPTEALEGHLAL